MRYFEGDVILKKLGLALIGVIGGFWLGMIIGVVAWSFYLIGIKKADVSGEESIALLLGAIPGAPIGAVVGGTLSFVKRNSKKWRIFFFILFFFSLLQFIFSLVSRLFIF